MIPCEQSSKFRKKFAEFLFAPNWLKRNLWLASRAHPYSPYAQDLCEKLFLGPLREGNYKHFRRVADCLKNMDMDAERPPGAEDQQNLMDHYAFWSAHYWLEHAPAGGWTTLKDLRKAVKELALKKWAAVEIWGPHMGICEGGHRNLLNLSLTDARQIKRKLRTTPKENGPKGTNWGRIWKDTGLMSLKDIYPDARQRSLTASTISRANQNAHRSTRPPATSRRIDGPYPSCLGADLRDPFRECLGEASQVGSACSLE
jgi:hypothetical protein